jgi:hypothetical protein
MKSSSNNNNNDDVLIQIQQHGLEMQEAASVFGSVITSAAYAYAAPLYNKEPYHTSILTGESWLQELLNGHLDRIQCELSVQKPIFLSLIQSLRHYGFSNSWNITLEEQLAILL